MIDASLAEVGEDVRARLAVTLSDKVAAMALGLAQPLLRLEPVQAAMVPPSQANKSMF